MILTFLVSGLWHGANWTFIVWGFLHGMYLIAEKQFPTYDLTNKWKNAFKMVFTFFLVCFAWIFFRANNLGEALFVIDNILNMDVGYNQFYLEAKMTGISMLNFILCFFYLTFLTFVELTDLKIHHPSKKLFLRFLFYYFILFSIIFFGVDGKEAFIYFQF